MKKRLLAGFMACALVLSLLPTAALAAGGDVSYQYCDSSGQNWQTGIKSSGDYTAVTADDTAWTSGWYVASGTVTIGTNDTSQRVSVTGDVHLILEDGCNLTINGGINVAEGNSLTIYGQQNGTGKLTARAMSNYLSGIGGNKDKNSGTITINGGDVTADGRGQKYVVDTGGAGIGSGWSDSGGTVTITINGGTVTAFGGNYCAGIGVSSDESRSTITINGGTVNATGGFAGGVGIGGKSGDSTITITGGTVSARCGSTSSSAGISGAVTISDGTLKNTHSSGNSFTMTSGMLEGCNIQNSASSVDNAVIKNSTVNNLSSWTDANNTVTGSTLNFSNETTLTKGGTGNTYGGSVILAEGVSFDGNTTFKDAVAINKNNLNFPDNTTFNGDVAVNGNSVGFSDSTTFNSTVTVIGDSASFSGTTTANGAVIISGGNASFAGGTTTVKGAVTITGSSASFSGSTAFTDAVTISGSNASFSGSTTFKSTVGITGSATLDGSTELTGDMTISAGGTLTNNGTLTVPTGCTISSSGGTITNAEDAVINLSGVLDRTNGTLTNNGTIFLVSDGEIKPSDVAVTPNAPVSSGATPIPAGEIVIDLSTVKNAVTIGPKEYTIDGTAHAYDPARNVIVLTGEYKGTISGTNTAHAAAVTVLENTTASITLRDVNIGWEKDYTYYCSSIWVKDYCAVTVFLEGNNTLKPKDSGSGIRTEEHSSLTVEGTGTLNLDLSNGSTIRGIGNYSYNNENFGSITINGGTINETIGSSTSTTWVAAVGGKQGTLVMNGGTLKGDYVFGAFQLGKLKNYQCVINGGVINSTMETNINYGSLTINGGEVSMPTVYCYGDSGGNITVNGGQLTLTATIGNYLFGNITINGGTITGRIGTTTNGTTKINGGSAKLTKHDDNNDNIASVTTSDGKTAYRTVLTGQTSVASVLVDGKSQNISYNHPDDPAGTADNNLYLYLVHDENATAPETHTVVVMYQNGTRKEYKATWSGDPTNAFTFGNEQASNPTTDSSIGMTMTGTTTNQETGKPEKTYGDAKPVVVTVNLTTGQTNNALPPSNGPMLAAENSLPYAFKTVILLCNGKEIQRKDVPENQTSVVFYVQTQAWTPGEYKFTATYGGDATTDSSAIAETDAQTLNIVGQKLDKNALTVNVAVSGTYGQKVSELAVSGTVTQSGLEIPGTWAIGAVSGDPVLDVGTSQTLTATFTPSGKGYDDTLTRTVTPTINKATPTVTAPTAASSLAYNGSAQNLISAGSTTGGTLQYSTDGTTWSTDIPTGTNAGNYAVYYKVVGGNNYNDVAAQSVSPVTISQKSISGATVAVSGTPTYTGAAVEPAVTVTLDGNQLTATTDYTVSYKDNTAVGNNSATATVTGTGNYTGTASTNFSIDKATPTVNVSVSISGDAGARQAEVTVTVTGVTGGAAPTGTVTLTGDNGLNQTLNLTNGTASYTWSSLTDGQHTVKAEYVGDSNYNAVSNVEKTFDTSKREQDTLAIVSVGNKTYGDSAFILSTTGGSGNGAVTFTSSDPSVIRISGTTATIHKAGGPVTITAKKAEDTTYNEATATLNITVAKKAVVFKANDKTVQQGGTMPTFDYAAVTLAQGDTITTEPTATCTAANTNTVGTFTITFSGAVLSSPDNYEVSYQPGTLTITAKPSTGGGGGGGGYTPPTYKPDITKPSGGGDTPGVTPSNPKQGDTVTVTPKPDDGHEVGGITVTDKNGKPVEVTKKPDGTYTFKQPNGKVTIDVTYRPIDRPWNNPFSDVSESDWFYEAVKFVHQRGLMNGYSDGRFGPNDNLSRAQLAQILFNKEGRPGVNYLLTFSDVAGEAWYTEAIRWATSQGIVGGYGNGMFGPNDPITREQLAVMLWRYSGNPAATDKELHFNDADEISGFALEAMRWAVENGVLNGYGDGRLGPKGQATRAQVAQMLKNFIENQEENT